MADYSGADYPTEQFARVRPDDYEPDHEPAPGRPRRWPIVVLTLVVMAALIGGVALWLGNGDDKQAGSSESSAAESTSQVQVPPSTKPPGQQPGTIRLPEGGTAKLVRRELTADGTLPIPDGLEEATWWGAGLGAPKGASLLSGHVNWKGKKGPFDELWRDKVGQMVEIVDASGGRWTYKVTEVLTLAKGDLPSQADKLFGQGGPHRLVLVTCGGEYIGGTDGYKDNRIVFAELATRP